jgi:radical SAM superfamily enzyme YgiQ (UPF0313 family)
LSGSIFFDDDTWNLGNNRVRAMCAGLKEIGLPWTMMGRIDTSTLDVYDTMVNSGCVGMRFGVESFNQQLLDNTKKNLSAETSYTNLKYLVTRFSGLEFHFTTMRNLPGEQPGSWNKDQQVLQELVAEGARHNNRVHYQISDCVPVPGTELWQELVDLGLGETEAYVVEVMGIDGPETEYHVNFAGVVLSVRGTEVAVQEFATALVR